jgi:hypothetical protein
MDPEFGAVDHGAELTCLGATDQGAEVLGLKTISVTLLWNSFVKKFVCKMWPITCKMESMNFV